MRLRMLLLGVASLLILPIAVGGSGPRDCDSNAIVYCGAYVKGGLINKIQNGDGRNSDLKQIFNHFGVGIPAIRSANTVPGFVRSDNTVWVGEKQVATGALAAGRKFMPGSTKSGSVWLRPPSTTFKSSQLEAFVHLQDGKFKWAIIKSCGNFVSAKPFTPAVEQPKPQPEQPKPQPQPEKPQPPVTPTAPPPPTPSEQPKAESKGGAPQRLPEAGSSFEFLHALGLAAIAWQLSSLWASRQGLRRARLDR